VADSDQTPSFAELRDQITGVAQRDGGSLCVWMMIKTGTFGCSV
jgi:hypothetical protein